MADDRYTYINQPLHSNSFTSASSDSLVDWQLPTDDIILVPDHLIPPFQDELEDEHLPQQTHPSYPFGNPYRNNSLSLLNHHHDNNNDNSHSSSTTTYSSNLFPSRLPKGSSSYTSTYRPSLVTSLPSLLLPSLYAQTSLGHHSQRTWNESHLNGLFGPKTRWEREEERREREEELVGHGDAGAPAGQNAADETLDGMDQDEEGEGDDEEEGDGENSENGRGTV